MEAELIKENVITSYPSANLTLNIIAEGETIVPDSKSDIAEIILVEGRSYIEKTEIQKGRIVFTGIAEFYVLYAPEGSDEISSINAKIPFNHIEECEHVAPEDKYSILPSTLNSECTLLNSRKISLKSTISVNFISYSDIAIPVVSNIKSSDIEVKKENVYFSHLTSCLKESFTVSDFLDLPSSSSSVSSLLLCRASVNDYSVKAVTGKAVVKGTLTVFTLYLTNEGTISHMQHDIPFTEILDAPSLTDESVCDINFCVNNYSITEDFSNPDKQTFAFTADITLSVASFSTEKRCIITDAYFPGCETKLFASSCKKSEILCNENKTLTLKESIDLPLDLPPMEQICPLSATITGLSTKTEGSKILLSGTVSVNIIYLYSGTQKISCHTHQIAFNEIFDCPSEHFDVYAGATVTHADFNFINQAKLDLRCLVEVSIRASKNTASFNSINNVIIGDALIKSRPSIIVYFVKSGDTLWDIAKRYSTTAERITSANALEKDDIINVGMRLLIPV